MSYILATYFVLGILLYYRTGAVDMVIVIDDHYQVFSIIIMLWHGTNIIGVYTPVILSMRDEKLHCVVIVIIISNNIDMLQNNECIFTVCIYYLFFVGRLYSNDARASQFQHW